MRILGDARNKILRLQTLAHLGRIGLGEDDAASELHQLHLIAVLLVRLEAPNGLPKSAVDPFDRQKIFKRNRYAKQRVASEERFI